MNLRSYEAPDSRAAMQMIREHQGDDAVIISSESTPDGIRIVAATDFDASMLPQKPSLSLVQKTDATAKIPAPGPGKTFDLAALPPDMQRALTAIPVKEAKAASPRGVFSSILSGLRGATAAGSRSLSFGRRKGVAAQVPAQDLPAIEGAQELRVAGGTDTMAPEVLKMRDELGSMRKMIERSLGQLSDDRLRGSPTRSIAMDLLQGYGCPPAMVSGLAAEVDPSLDERKVLPAVRALLEDQILVSGTDPLQEGGVIALVGPTGAGKTTTAAKLAARFAAQHSARDVALITTDQHRAAAREQLQAHGRRLGVTVIEANGPESLAEVLKQMADYPLVIIDTAGLSPRDKSQISQLNLLRATDHVRTMLVLPASGNAQDLKDLISTYSRVKPDSIVLTKIDETARLGGALSAAIHSGLPISFTGTGQDVPADLELASASALASRIDDVPPHDDEHDENHHAVA